MQDIKKVNMKNMLYQEQLQAIQDDLLPFGFIVKAEEEEVVVEVDNNGEQWIVEEPM